jgi:diguanylate cyclase (GGDEF)-like protein
MTKLPVEDPTASQTRAGHGRGVRLLMLGAIIGAVGGFAAVWSEHGTVAHYAMPWWILAALFYAGEVCLVDLQFRRGAFSFSMNEVPLVLGLFFASPRELLVTLIIGSGLALLVQHRLSLLKATFNVSNFAIDAALAIVVTRWLLPRPFTMGLQAWLVIGIATVCAAALGCVTVSAAISLSERTVDIKRLVFALGAHFSSALTNLSIGLAAATVTYFDTDAAWLLAIPAAMVFVAYRAYIREREKHEILEFLFASNRILTQNPDLEQAIVALLEQAKQMFRTETAEAVIAPPDDAPLLRIRLDGEHAPRVMEQVTDGSTLAMWDRIATSPRPTIVSSSAAAGRRQGKTVAHTASNDADGYLVAQSLRNAMIAPLRGETRAIGMLMIGDRMGEGTSFGKQDLRLFEALANNVSVALENGRLEQSLSHLRELEQKLTLLAFHDPLTGLANRSLFSDRVVETLAAAKAEDRTCAVLFIDLDDFKTVNDTLGHEAGDQLLAAVAERITSCLRPTDQPARLGGDEFAVIIEDALSGQAAERVAARITDALRLPVPVNGCDLYIRASIGIATSQDVHSADEMLRNADLAMYMAKADGKGRYRWFRPSMRADVVKRHQLKSDLERAADNGEFQVYYQPIVDLHTGRPVAAEALVRWLHPERGLIFPAAFIPAAERSGLINEIGRFVLQDACSRVLDWQRVAAAGPTPFAVSVNLSPAQFAQPDLVSQVEEAVEVAGINPASLILEITEGLMLQGSERVLRVLDRLSSFGVRMAMDDFGTGYASLSSLRELPMDMIKIAKTFTDDISGNEEKSPFVRAMIELGEALGLVTLAEGIETGQQARELDRLGCQLGQGFHFARPVPAAGIDSLLKRYAEQHDKLAKVIAFPA